MLKLNLKFRKKKHSQALIVSASVCTVLSLFSNDLVTDHMISDWCTKYVKSPKPWQNSLCSCQTPSLMLLDKLTVNSPDSDLDKQERLSPFRLSDCWPGPSVPDPPRPRPDLHPPTAAPRVGHHTLLHHPGHHLPYRHLCSAGDVTLVPRGHAIRPMDRLHRE